MTGILGHMTLIYSRVIKGSEFDVLVILLDYTTMAQVKKLDGKRRAIFPEGFSAGDVFLEEVSGELVTYRLIQPVEVPLAKVEKRDGRSFVKAPLEKKAIVDAVRRERD